MANPVEQAKEQMNKSVENTKENFAGIRTGRANPRCSMASSLTTTVLRLH